MKSAGEKKIDNFQLGQIEKIVSFSERGSLTENNVTITSAQLLMVMEKFKFFKNFKIEIAHVIFRTIFNESEFFFWSIAQIERGFQKLGHWVTKTVRLKTFNSSRWPWKFTLKVG